MSDNGIRAERIVPLPEPKYLAPGAFWRVAGASGCRRKATASEGAVGTISVGPGMGRRDEYSVTWLAPFHALGRGEHRLYLSPPATIPAAEVQALVERLRRVVGVMPGSADRRTVLLLLDELAKLIPRNPE